MGGGVCGGLARGTGGSRGGGGVVGVVRVVKVRVVAMVGVVGAGGEEALGLGVLDGIGGLGRGDCAHIRGCGVAVGWWWLWWRMW